VGGAFTVPVPTVNSQMNVFHWKLPVWVKTSLVCQKEPVVGSMEVAE